MPNVRIETDGLTLKEVYALEAVVGSLDGVADAQFVPVLPGSTHHRSFEPQAGLCTLHVLVRLIESAASGTAIAAGHHLYKRVAEGVIDKVWESVKVRLTGKSDAEVGVRLYGPDGELLKEHRGKR